jgi:hypothetical protein
MNRASILNVALALPLAAGLLAAGCAQKPAATAAGPASKPDNVAVVDGHPISRNTYNFYVKSVAGKPAEDLTPEQRGQLLDNLIRAEVVAQAAEKDGLAAQDETRAVTELSRLTVLQQASSQAYLKDRKASQEELQAEYDLQVASMAKKQYRASHICEEAATRIDELARVRPSPAANRSRRRQQGRGGPRRFRDGMTCVRDCVRR